MAIEAKTGLITLQQAKLYLGLADTSTADDRLIDGLVSQASQLIRRQLACGVLRETYAHEEYGYQPGYYLFLNNWPVVNVNRVCIDRVDAMTVTYTGAGTHATVEVTPDAVRVRVAASGAWTTTELTFADYATITLIAAAVSAVSGFTAAAVSGYGGWPSTELLRRPAMDCKNVTIYGSVPDTSETDYELYDADWGVLYNPYGWGAGRRVIWPAERQRLSLRWRTKNVYIDYEAGWTRASLPEPIQSATEELVALFYNRSKRDPTLTSESIGDYSWSSAFAGSSADAERALGMVFEKLTPYRRLLVQGA